LLISSFFPPPGVEQTEMPQKITDAIEGCLAIYSPERERKTAAGGGFRIPRNTPPVPDPVV
jgi:hypothetical protein